MKKSITVLAAIVLTSFIYASCGNAQSESGKDISETIVDEDSNSVEDNVKRKKVEDFVKTFYESMELTQPEVEKLMETYDDDFLQAKIDKLSNMNAFKTKERVKNLTGMYHDRYYVELIKIDSININDNQIKAYTTVLYQLDEVGSFYNLERIDISEKSNEDFQILDWSDLKLSKMELKDYEGLEDFSEKDFYKSIDHVW